MPYELSEPEKIALHTLEAVDYDGLTPSLVKLIFGKEFLTYFDALVEKGLVNLEERQTNGLKIGVYIINDEGKKH